MSMASISETKVNKSSESGHPCLVSDLREYFQLFITSWRIDGETMDTVTDFI